MSPETPDALDTVPWWEQVPKGRVIPLAFVKIDLKGGTAEWAELSPEDVKKRRDGYRAGVESLARATQAAQPLNWQGDGVTLFLTDGDGEPAPLRAVRAAKLLWQRVRVDLSIPARIAVHAAEVPWDPDTGKLAHPAIDECGHLEHVAPENSIAITEDVYLSLPHDLQKDLAPLGITARDRTPAYVFPASAAGRKQSEQFVPSPELALWEAFRRYADSSEIRRLRYVGFRLTKKEPPSLDLLDVFVPLEFRPRVTRRMPLPSSLATGEHPSEDARERAALLAGIERAWSRSEETEGPPEELKSVFKDHRNLILLGDPGSGKTTLLRWLAVIAAKGRFLLARELGAAERLLPLPVSIGTLADTRREMGKTASVVQVLARYFHARNLEEEPQLAEFLHARLEEGACLLLLDGLDEVTGDERESVHTWLETFAARFPRNRFVVTSRRVGYTPFALPDGVELLLCPFDDGQVERYVKSFARAYLKWETGIEDPLTAKKAADDLLDALQSNPRLHALARNPFLLSALALVHRAEGKLPRHRVQFYEMVARALCETWGAARRIVAGEAKREIPYEEEGLPIFGALALEMHDNWPAGAVPKEFIIDTLSHCLQRKKGVSAEDATRTAEEFLSRAGTEVQVLLERGPGLWGFLHLTFQEFFAASGLLAQERFKDAVLKEHRLLNPRWEEVIRLGVGCMALIQNRPLAAQQFIEAVLGYRPPKGLEWITAKLKKQVPFAILLAAEAGDVLASALQDEITREFVEWSDGVPEHISGPVLRELSFTSVKERVAEAYVARLTHGKSAERERAAWALGQLKADAALGPLLDALKDRDSGVRRAAALALGQLKADAAVPSLLAAFKDGEMAWAVAEALARLNADAALPPLLAVLKDEDWLVRASAAQALARLNADPVVASLLEVLNDKDEHPMVRGRAAWALGQLKADAAVAPLLAALRDESQEVRVAAALSLGQLNVKAALSPLLAALKDEVPRVRWAAALALGQLKADAALQPLLAALKDKDLGVRWAAADALGQLKADAAVPSLVEALKDRNLWVRGAAAGALWLISEKAFLSDSVKRPVRQVAPSAKVSGKPRRRRNRRRPSRS